MNIPQIIIDEIRQAWSDTGGDLAVEDNESTIDYLIDATTFSDEAENAFTSLETLYSYKAVLAALAAHPQLQLV